MSEHAEVRKCAKCGTRVNWEWMQGVMERGTWSRRCTDPVCQKPDGWLEAEPDPVKTPDPPRPENTEFRAWWDAFYKSTVPREYWDD